MGKDLSRELDELSRLLPDVDRETLERELNDAITVFGLTPADARRTLVRKFGGDVRGLSAAERKMDRLEPFEVVSFRAKVISINERTIQREDGDVTMFYGILADDTATRPFTAWVDHGLQRGDVIEVHGAYVREWQGDLRLNIGEVATVRRLEGVEMETVAPVRQVTNLAQVTPDASCSLVVRILDMAEHTVNTQSGEKRILRGTIADETAKLPFTSWIPLDVAPGSVVRLENAYVRTWQGVPQINIGDNTRVEPLSSDALPPAEFLAGARSYAISDLAERAGMPDVSVTGMLIDIKGGSGLIFRCPECNRVLQRGVCMVHGRTEGEPDLRIKAIIDDGTGALTAIFPRALTERALDRTLDDALAEARERMDFQVIHDDLIGRMLMRRVTVSGNVSNDDFGLMMIVQDWKDAEIAPKEMAREIFSRLEAIQ
ncbi:MAG TPA: hypothetical protein EYP43_03335 [Thermoplasmata archaeon]|nr:hypothetical protein [Thermoplasmata archaeon]